MGALNTDRARKILIDGLTQPSSSPSSSSSSSSCWDDPDVRVGHDDYMNELLTSYTSDRTAAKYAMVSNGMT